MPINVSIVEDDTRIREGLSVLINVGDNIRCVSTYANGKDALAGIPVKKPDVVLMDINLPDISGIDCVQKLKSTMPELHIIMLTMYEDGDQIFKSLIAGAKGYLVKRTPPAEILKAIEEVHNGSSPMSGKVARIVVDHFQKNKPVTPENVHLSAREHEILALLAKGRRYKEIADALGLSFDTVRAHVRNIYEKLQVHSRTEAILKCPPK